MSKTQGPAGDCRYDHVKSIWTAGDLTSFHKIFTIVPKYIISEDLGVNYGRFSKKTENPVMLTVQEVMKLSELVGIDIRDMVQLIAMEAPSQVPRTKHEHNT